MSREVKRRRGSSAQHVTFVGAIGEITIDLTKNTVVVHDGSTPGGLPLPTMNGGETLTNKTLTSPIFTNPKTTNLDSGSTAPINFKTNGVEQLRVANYPAANNYVQIAGGITGAPPQVVASGSDTIVPLRFGSKGAGNFQFLTDWFGTGFEQCRIGHVVNAVNRLQIEGAATGQSTYFGTAGTDTHIPLTIHTKGQGRIDFAGANGTDIQARVTPTAGAVNFLNMSGAVSGGSPWVSVNGADANIPLSFYGKGTGGHGFFSGFGPQFSIGSTATTSTSYLTAYGSTSDNPHLLSSGAGANIDASILSKGTGGIHLMTNGGVEQFRVSSTTNAVNFMHVTGAVTGGVPFLRATGTDANVGMSLQTKGVHGWYFQSNFGAENQFVVSGTPSAVNYIQVSGAATTSVPFISAVGNDTNVGLAIQAKGTGAINFNTTGAGGFSFFTNNWTNTQFNIINTTGAVNYFVTSGSATGNDLRLISQGPDTNINAEIRAKGSAYVSFLSSGNYGLRVGSGPTAVNYFETQAGATGVAPHLTTAGSDTNIDLRLIPKGTGYVQFGTYAAKAAEVHTGYITIKDTAGNLRKVMVCA